MHRTRNAAYGQPYRGFESLPLRQPSPLRACGWQAASDLALIKIKSPALPPGFDRNFEIVQQNHTGGVAPSRPIRQAQPGKVLSACLAATMNTFAPGLMSLLSPGTWVTIGALAGRRAQHGSR
jgi:hypothetical protein